MRLTIILESGNRKGDLSLQFVNDKDLAHGAARCRRRDRSEQGLCYSKHLQVPVSNADNLKPKGSCAGSQDNIPFIFNINTLASVWRTQEWRPAAGSKSPEDTKSDFCIYDKPHRDYTYTPAAVKWLIRKCRTSEGFAQATGLEAKVKPTQPDADDEPPVAAPSAPY